MSTAEDAQQQQITPEAIKELVPSEPVCPSIAGVVLDQFPDLKTVIDVISQAGAAVDSALLVKAKLTETPTTGEKEKEAKSLLSTASEKITQTAERVAEEVEDQAEEIAAAAWDAWYATANSITRTTKAIQDGVINIGKAAENIDEITLNAIDAQFPGFKSAIDCLYGEPGGSVREGGVENAKKQVKTPPPANPAIDKEDTNPKRAADEGEDMGEPNEELSKLEASERELNDLIEQTGLEEGSIIIEVPNE